MLGLGVKEVEKVGGKGATGVVEDGGGKGEAIVGGKGVGDDNDDEVVGGAGGIVDEVDLVADVVVATVVLVLELEILVTVEVVTFFELAFLVHYHAYHLTCSTIGSLRSS